MRILLSLITVCGLPVIIRAVKSKKINCALLICYVISIFVITLAYRRADIKLNYSLNPFHAYKSLIETISDGIQQYGWSGLWKQFNEYKGQINSVVLNTLLFVPLGYLLPSVFRSLGNLWKVLGVGLVISLTIEIIQLITRLGWFDALDIIHNIAGAAIGYWIYKKWL